MKEASQTLQPQTLQDLHSIISSLVLGSGHTHLEMQDGKMIDLSALQASRVSHLAPRGIKKEKTTSDICSHTSSNSLDSANLTVFLVNKLKQQLDTGGSMIYQQQWKEKVTPLAILFWAHTASTPRTNAKDCIGWPTPSVRDMKGGYQGGRIRNGKISTDTLDVVAQIAGWATPNTMDTLPARSDQAMYNQARHGGRKGRTFPGNLREQVDQRSQMAYQDAKADAQKGITQSSGYTAKTKSTGQLNPALSRWLMGLPEAWCIAAVQSTQIIQP